MKTKITFGQAIAQCDHLNRGTANPPDKKMIRAACPRYILNMLFKACLLIFTFFPGTIKQSSAQNIKLYGSDMYGNKMLFIKLDPYTGTCTVIDTIPGIRATITFSSAYDQTYDHYIIWGLDNNWNQKVFTIDTGGNIVSAVSPPSDNIFGYQYDMNHQKMYAFKTNNSSDSLYFISLDVNFNINLIRFLSNDINAVAADANCINSVNGRYYISGVDNSYTKRLYCLDSRDSTIAGDPLLGNSSFGELAYDEPNNILYGLYKNVLDPSHKLRFAEIDTLSANPTILNPLSDLYAVVANGSIFDQSTGTYIFVGLDTNYVSRIYMIDAATGTIISEAILSAGISEIQCSNAYFAKSYHPITAIREEKISVTDEEVYPNPATDELIIISKSSDLKNNTTILIYDIQGQLLFSQPMHQNKTSIDLSKYEKGVYFMRIAGEDKQVVKKIVKE